MKALQLQSLHNKGSAFTQVHCNGFTHKSLRGRTRLHQMLALTALRRSSSALAAARSCGGVARELSSSACLGKDASFTYTPPGRNHLFVPGPTNIPERIQRVMVRLTPRPPRARIPI